MYTWDAANRLVNANVDGVVSSFEQMAQAIARRRRWTA
jgi:hypothetical protein